jgi:hypothetical protein
MPGQRALTHKQRAANNEAELKRELVLALEAEMPRSICVRIEDRFRAGIPDILHTWSRMTSFLEVKYADPELTGRDVQWETCMKLAEQGSCWYVVYERRFFEKNEYLNTLILSPFSLSFPDWQRRARLNIPGHNHVEVAKFIANVHTQMERIDATDHR